MLRLFFNQTSPLTTITRFMQIGQREETPEFCSTLCLCPRLQIQTHFDSKKDQGQFIFNCFLNIHVQILAQILMCEQMV